MPNQTQSKANFFFFCVYKSALSKAEPLFKFEIINQLIFLNTMLIYDVAPVSPRKFSLWQQLQTFLITFMIFYIVFFSFFMLTSSRAYVHCSCSEWLPTEAIYTHSRIVKGGKGVSTTKKYCFNYTVDGQMKGFESLHLGALAPFTKFEALYLAANPDIARPASVSCFTFSMMWLSLFMFGFALIGLGPLFEFKKNMRLLRWGIIKKAKRGGMTEEEGTAVNIKYEYEVDKLYHIEQRVTKEDAAKASETSDIIYLAETPDKAVFLDKYAKKSPDGALIIGGSKVVKFSLLLSLAIFLFALLMPLEWIYNHL
jgi:hypothetical protein